MDWEGDSPSVALVISVILLSAEQGTRKGLPWKQGDFIASPPRPKPSGLSCSVCKWGGLLR